ncbi:DUF6470 family protein [Desulfitobacterium sp. Sab5]|uniref:DUF6470 family protein n=1 Tax=Desulfitobacterium nosdiversum TaxID=3375356 RepID=UPI003CEB2E7E
MVDLQINQQFGRIGLKIIPFQYDLKQQAPDLQIQQTPAQISITQPAATLEIDYTPAREALGYCGINTQLKQFNQEAMTTSMEGILRRVHEGYELGHIEKKVSVAQVVKEATAPREKDLELVVIPPIEVKVSLNSFGFDVNQGGVKGTFTPGTIQGDFTYGTVHTYLEQEPSISIHAIGSAVDIKA